MRFARSGRFVFVAHWPAAVVLPLFVLFGRWLVGAELGLLVFFGVLVLPIAIAVLLVPPLLTLFDRESRRVFATRLGYDVATFVLWAGCLVAGASIEDARYFAETRSAVSTWLGLSSTESDAVFAAAIAVVVASYIAAVVLASVGIARGRAREMTDAAAPA